jgi:nucleotide-binding universal stress UspA family protein
MDRTNSGMLLLVPLDGSSTAEEALPMAAAIAHRNGFRLHLAAVHEPLPLLRSLGEELDLELEEQRATQLEEYLRWAVNAVATTHGIEASWSLLKGSPARVLAEHARAKHANLIIMTTHGHSGVSRLWLGSVADQLLRRVSIPVLLLHPKREARSEFRHILVALDGSRDAELVLETALGLGSLMPEVRYALIRVVEPPIPVITRLAVYPAPHPASVAEEESRAAAYLKSLAEPLLARGLQVSTEVLSGRNVADKIQEAAHARGADLIVLGTHGASGLERMMLGSVADKVIRGTSAPVLVVPTRGERQGSFEPDRLGGDQALMTMSSEL